MKNDKSLLVPPTNEQRIGLAKLRLEEEISKYLEKNPRQSPNGIAQIIGVNHATIYSWLDGTFKTSPKRENIDKLARLLKVNPLYLLGESNLREVDSENMDLRKLIGENALLGLRKLQDNIDELEEIKDYTTFDDFKYSDIIGMVIGDVTFWRTLMHEAKRLIKLQTSEYTQNEFERILNKSSDGMIDNPTRIEYMEVVHNVNSNAINNIFDSYIEKKKNELKIKEIEFEERVPSSILKIDKHSS